MGRVEDGLIDNFIFAGMEEEIEELKKDIDCLIKILNKHHIPIPEHIKKKMVKGMELPFN